MAYKDSGELPADNRNYALGGYSIELEVQNTHEPGEPDAVSVFSICRGPDGTRRTIAKDFPAGTILENWRVEANETTADVYATVTLPIINPWNFPPFSPAIVSRVPYTPGGGLSFIYSTPVHAIKYQESGGWYVAAAATPFFEDNQQHTITYAQSYTYNYQTVYWMRSNDNGCSDLPRAKLDIMYLPEPYIAWQMIYGAFEEKTQELLVARFAIDIKTANGGPGGDYDEAGSDGDPEKTLRVSVRGASGGSCEGEPPEREAQKRYGTGGDGGNGGGGGAGAGGVIIYKFATSRARRVVQQASSGGAGLGGKGGKGGKGGDGCILIFW